MINHFLIDGNKIKIPTKFLRYCRAKLSQLAKEDDSWQSPSDDYRRASRISEFLDYYYQHNFIAEDPFFQELVDAFIVFGDRTISRAIGKNADQAKFQLLDFICYLCFDKRFLTNVIFTEYNNEQEFSYLTELPKYAREQLSEFSKQFPNNFSNQDVDLSLERNYAEDLSVDVQIVSTSDKEKEHLSEFPEVGTSEQIEKKNNQSSSSTNSAEIDDKHSKTEHAEKGNEIGHNSKSNLVRDPDIELTVHPKMEDSNSSVSADVLESVPGKNKKNNIPTDKVDKKESAPNVKQVAVFFTLIIILLSGSFFYFHKVTVGDAQTKTDSLMRVTDSLCMLLSRLDSIASTKVLDSIKRAKIRKDSIYVFDSLKKVYPYGLGNGEICIYSTCGNCANLKVYVDDTLLGIIDGYFDVVPNVGEDGSLYKYLSKGKHTVYAIDASDWYIIKEQPVYIKENELYMYPLVP